MQVTLPILKSPIPRPQTIAKVTTVILIIPAQINLKNRKLKRNLKNLNI